MDYEMFLERNPASSKVVHFTNDELSKLVSAKLPDELLHFFKTFGRCTFANGFLSAIHPDDIDSEAIFKAWGFKKGPYNIFLKTCFGVVIYYHKGGYYYLNPHLGVYNLMAIDFDSLINYALRSNLMIKNVFRYDIYMAHLKSLPKLKEDEIYMLVPAIPLGGSFETSKFEHGKAFEHLCFLAELYDNKAKKL